MRIISLLTLTFALASCSVTRMSDVFPETASGDYGDIVIDDHKTSYSPIVSGKSSAEGYGEVVGVQVYKGKGVQSGCSSNASCHSAGNAFRLGGTTVLNPYAPSAHYGLGGNVGLPGFATLPYSAGAWASGYYHQAPVVLNSASNAGISCEADCHCGAHPNALTCRKTVKQTEQNTK